MTRDARPALMMDTEAETMLARLAPTRVGDAVSRANASTSARHQLAGLLRTPEGTVWAGRVTYCQPKRNGERGRRLVPTDLVTLAVLGQ